MKNLKPLLAAILVAASAGNVSAQNSVTVYGIVNAELNYVNGLAGGGRRLALESGNLQGSRLGFRGYEDLGGGLSASFVLEQGLALDTGTITQGGAVFGRQSWLAIAGPFGRISAGRQYDYAYSDLNPLNSVVWLGNTTFGAHANNLDRAVGGRVINSLKWQSPTVRGFSGAVIYGLGEQTNSTSNGRSLGVGGKYDDGTLRMGLSYFQSNASADAGASITVPSSDLAACPMGGGRAGDKCLETYMLAGSYKLGDASFYAAYSKVKLPLAVVAGARSFGSVSNSGNRILDVGVTYNIGNLRLIGSAIHSRANFVGSATAGRVSQVSLGANYFLSKRTDIYTFVTHQRSRDMLTPGIFGQGPGSDHSQSALQTGIRHTF